MEVLRLLKFLEQGQLQRAYVLLAGPGWSYIHYFLSESFLQEFRSPSVSQLRVLTLDQFIALANEKKL
jgi:hypothetical protein